MGEAKRKFTVVESIQIEGRQIPVHKVMTYNECWIHRYHSEPIADITGKEMSERGVILLYYSLLNLEIISYQ